MNRVFYRHAFAKFMVFYSILLGGLCATDLYALVMEAEDYSWAYDATPGNRGGEYRDGDVDIGRSDDSNPFYVGWVEEDEWLAFDGFVVTKTGTYEIKARVASQVGGEFSIDLDAGSIQLGTFTVPNTGGWHNWETISMTVELTAGDYNFGLFANTDGWNLNWIDVTPVASNVGDDVVWAVNSGGAEYQSSDGISYLQDEGFVGGEAANTESEIKATPDALLYQTERWGENFSYVKDLPNSTYSVTFRFAEIYWQSANQRQFSVKVEGETRLQNVDIAAEKGNRSLAAYDLTVPNIVVNDGQLNIDFDYIKDAAKVSAFVVREQRAPSPNWQLVWSDEFNNDGAVDGNKWTHELWAPGRVNNEWQRYTNRLENSRVENGKLIIEARKDGFMGDDYSSARIKSQGKGDLLYGRVEVRAKLPNGRGTWPAIWMMPTDVYKYATTCDLNTGWDSDCNAWPNSGEIDIMEHVGYDTGRVHGTVHNKAGYWVNGQQRQGTIDKPSVDDEFHTYAMEWSPDRIDMFVDDTLYFTYINENQGYEQWPYDHSFYLIMNIAVGGDWGGAAGVDPNIWPQRMEVDYVRLYKTDTNNTPEPPITTPTPTPTPTPTTSPTPTPTPTVIPGPISISDINPLFNSSTSLEPDSQYEIPGALVTRFSDRPRTRHAREDEYQSYDHYIKFYFEHRSSNIEIIDRVAKGGSSITMNVRTLWPLDEREAENRWWYWGQNTVAHYTGNGTMDYQGTDGTYFYYTKTDAWNRQYNRPIQMGDRLEFEISQFSRNDIPRGQSNYYGTTFLYLVGEGIVPWYTENAGEFVAGREPFQEDSRKIPEEYWLGGDTTLHYQYTNEPSDHFIQMATNIGYDNAQKFLTGRRVHHSSAISGVHDEDPANGTLDQMVNKAGSHYINERCTDCHERNGSSPVAGNGELLDRWVFKIGDENGNPHPLAGSVLQPKARGVDSEGTVSISHWTELGGGLRKPNYQFTDIQPPTFSARIAPRLVGLGLLEAIPEESILDNADPNDENNDGISGRANLTQDPSDTDQTRLGRFGWKAATSSVAHQVASALNTDMGVMTSVMPSPDCGRNQDNCFTSSPLDDNSYENLVDYISLLGIRPQRGMETGVKNESIARGKEIFSEIGCHSCHTPTFVTSSYHPHAELRDQVIHPYSDLLLHDMGGGLADNLGEGLATGSEWRTAPLWGLGRSACVTGGVVNPSGREGGEVCTPHHAYLHDGRARSIEEAILWHGGESEQSKQNYNALPQNDKSALLEFLGAL